MARTSEAAEKTLAQRQSGEGLGYCLWVGAGACGDVQRPYGASPPLPLSKKKSISSGHNYCQPSSCMLTLVCFETFCFWFFVNRVVKRNTSGIV